MPDAPTQPMLGLVLEPTIAIHRGEAFVCQCVQCGALVAVTSTAPARRPRDLGACPSCHQDRGWSHQHVPVGPFRAEWAGYLTGAVHALLTGPESEREERLAHLRDAYRRAARSTRETAPWHAHLFHDLGEAT